MTLYRKSVRLRDFDIHSDIHKIKLPKGMEAQHRQLDNKEAFTTLISDSKEDINNKLSELKIISDRVRTLNQVPKFRRIDTKLERIQ